MNALQEPFPKFNKIEELESLRGLAALLIVFFHFPKWNSILDVGLINNGYLMVQTFFVLSGFVIFYAYSERIKVKKDLLRFQLLRFGRLYPIHLIFLLFFLMVEFAKYVASTHIGIENIKSNAFELNNLTAFLKNIFLISSVLPNEPLTYNQPAWSISVEFYTYLVFGVGILLLKKNSTILFSAIGLSSLFLIVSESTYGFDALLNCFSGFFIGCLTASLIKKIKINTPGYLSFVIFLSIIIFLQLKVEKHYDILIYFLTAGLIVSLVLSPNGALNKILRLKFLTYLGVISYSIYMSHSAVQWIAIQVLMRIMKRPEIVGIDGRSVLQLSEIESYLACITVIIITVIVSAITYALIEKPMRIKSRNFTFSRLN